MTDDMSAEELARIMPMIRYFDQIGSEWYQRLDRSDKGQALVSIATAITEAVAAEREACVEIGRSQGTPEGNYVAAAIEARAIITCNHEWIDIRNEIILSGEMCIKCNALRAGNILDNEEKK